MQMDDLARNRGEFLSGDGPESDIVISSRVRLARNISGFPFLARCNSKQKKEIEDQVRAGARSVTGRKLTYLPIDELEELDRQLLVERHLISRQQANGEGARGVAVGPSESMAIMVNEEDHVRMQVLHSGLQLESCWDEVNALDDALEGKLNFAFHSRFGYLTACPTNVGTGIRVSVMLHLPALKLAGEIEKVFQAAKDMHLAVRGLYGEGTEATGDFYQISNQVTLGISEQEIISRFGKEVIPRVVEYERVARKTLMLQREIVLEDRIWRALGMLRSARQMSSEETLYLLSAVRMGVNLGRVNDVDIHTVNELFIQTQPAHLQRIRGQRLSSDQRNVARAEYIRSRLESPN
jgi:protein arginine kinase